MAVLDTLAQLHNAIILGLRAKLNGLLSIDAYPLLNAARPLPALSLELTRLEPGTDPRTGETALIGRFLARLVVDPAEAHAELLVRELAACLAAAITHETWGLAIGAAHFVQSSLDTSKAELATCLVWGVEWTHEFHLGEVLAWQTHGKALAGTIADYPEGMAPADATHFPRVSTLLLGLYPDTGLNKEERYWDAADEPER